MVSVSESVGVLASIMGVVMSLSYFPQAYKIFRSKSSGNISLFSYILLGFGTLTWLVYGLLIGDGRLIAGFSLGVLGSFLVFFLAWYYRN